MRLNTIVEKLRKMHYLIFSYILSAAIAVLVYITGGTNKVYTNLMYLPIAIVASLSGKKQGVIHAAISALLIGPFMPLDVASHTEQASINWIIRLIIYMIIAFVIGFFSDFQKMGFEISQKKDKEIHESQIATIYSLVKLAESRDDHTGEHIERVAVLCRLLATKLLSIPEYKDYIDEDYIENIYRASPLHDIGKVGISDNILLKPGKLSEEEYETMKAHTTIGANTLIEVKKKYEDNKFLEMGINIAYYHHEKWDGTGYPYGLAGESIPLSARIMAIVDVYDALRSKRVYKEAYSHEKSIEIIKQGAGTNFDPVVLDVFIQNESEFEDAFDKFEG